MKTIMTHDWSKTIEYLNKNFTLDGATQRMCASLLEYLETKYDGTKPHEIILTVFDAFGFEETDLEHMMACGAIKLDIETKNNG